MQSEPKPDPRDAEVYEVLRALGVLVLLHGLCLVMGLADSLFVLKGYIWIACCLLPLASWIHRCGSCAAVFRGLALGANRTFHDRIWSVELHSALADWTRDCGLNLEWKECRAVDLTCRRPSRCLY